MRDHQDRISGIPPEILNKEFHIGDRYIAATQVSFVQSIGWQAFRERDSFFRKLYRFN